MIVLEILANACQGSLLIYDTEDSNSLEHYDCIFYTLNNETVSYCQQLDSGPWQLDRSDASCQNDGVEWTFESLYAANITPNELLQWSSSIEKADDYAAFYFDNKKDDLSDTTVCNCTKPGTFGLNCEYQLTHGMHSIEAAIHAQFTEKDIDEWRMQFYGNIVCYETLICDDGLLCLDWRMICNGHQDCLNGLDEENCDKLEYNECEEDEYRCANGMCIPEEYWLDGEFR
jgi:hypothetical protein